MLKLLAGSYISTNLARRIILFDFVCQNPRSFKDNITTVFCDILVVMALMIGLGWKPTVYWQVR